MKKKFFQRAKPQPQATAADLQRLAELSEAAAAQWQAYERHFTHCQAILSAQVPDLIRLYELWADTATECAQLACKLNLREGRTIAESINQARQAVEALKAFAAQ